MGIDILGWAPKSFPGIPRFVCSYNAIQSTKLRRMIGVALRMFQNFKKVNNVAWTTQEQGGPEYLAYNQLKWQRCKYNTKICREFQGYSYQLYQSEKGMRRTIKMQRKLLRDLSIAIKRSKRAVKILDKSEKGLSSQQNKGKSKHRTRRRSSLVV